MPSISKERLSQIIKEEITSHFHSKTTKINLLNEVDAPAVNLPEAKEFKDLVAAQPKIVAKAIQVALQNVLSGRRLREWEDLGGKDLSIIYRYVKAYDERTSDFFDRNLKDLLSPKEAQAFSAIIGKET